jgi:hypothetical protein
MPARFMPGMMNSTASSGEVISSPDSRSSELLPPTRWISPTTRNSVAWMVMWCAV